MVASSPGPEPTLVNVDVFVRRVEEQTELDSRDAVAVATEATLRPLGARLAPETAGHVATNLPAELADIVDTGTEAEPFGVPAFLERARTVARERDALDPTETEPYVRAVFAGLAASLQTEEWHDVRSRLPDAYVDRFEPA